MKPKRGGMDHNQPYKPLSIDQIAITLSLSSRHHLILIDHKSNHDHKNSQMIMIMITITPTPPSSILEICFQFSEPVLSQPLRCCW